MPAIIFLGIAFGVTLSFGVFALMFFSVALSGPSQPDGELTEEQARAWFRRVSNRRIDPSDGHSPTFGELIQRGHLEELRDVSPRSTVS